MNEAYSRTMNNWLINETINCIENNESFVGWRGEDDESCPAISANSFVVNEFLLTDFGSINDYIWFLRSGTWVPTTGGFSSSIFMRAVLLQFLIARSYIIKFD